MTNDQTAFASSITPARETQLMQWACDEMLALADWIADELAGGQMTRDIAHRSVDETEIEFALRSDELRRLDTNGVWCHVPSIFSAKVDSRLMLRLRKETVAEGAPIGRGDRVYIQRFAEEFRRVARNWSHLADVLERRFLYEDETAKCNFDIEPESALPSLYREEPAEVE